MVIDWKTIQNAAEKYQAYLCSEEWGRKRAAVIRRCSGMCERCHASKMSHVHHLTYARKYAEHLDDLMGVCVACHDIIHGRSVEAEVVKQPVSPERKDWLRERLLELPPGLTEAARRLLRMGHMRARQRMLCQQQGRQFIFLNGRTWIGQ